MLRLEVQRVALPVSNRAILSVTSDISQLHELITRGCKIQYKIDIGNKTPFLGREPTWVGAGQWELHKWILEEPEMFLRWKFTWRLNWWRGLWESHLLKQGWTNFRVVLSYLMISLGPTPRMSFAMAIPLAKLVDSLTRLQETYSLKVSLWPTSCRPGGETESCIGMRFLGQARSIVLKKCLIM